MMSDRPLKLSYLRHPRNRFFFACLMHILKMFHIATNFTHMYGYVFKCYYRYFDFKPLAPIRERVSKELQN